MTDTEQETTFVSTDPAHATQEEFDDAIHILVSATRRPKDEAAEARVREHLELLFDLCGADEQRWKKLVLCLVCKRYHLLSPHAKALQKEQDESSRVTAGDGERRIFYLALRLLFERLQQQQHQATSAPDSPQAKALAVLCRIAPLAGGSRDICSLIEEMVDSILKQGLAEQRAKMMTQYGKESLSLLVGSGVKLIGDGDDKEGQTHVLHELLNLAAQMLDHDLALVQNNGAKQDELPSTLHIFVPHRDRGAGSRKKKKAKQAKVSDRQLVNSVAEILIWSKTTAVAKDNQTFAACHENFLDVVSDQQGAKIVKDSLHDMQCIIRKQRQTLNTFARSNGFMLSSQFGLDPDVLNIDRIKRGKAGDITTLTHLAKTKQASRVLQLINKRFSDPSKATKFGSVSEMVSGWAQKPPAESGDEILQLDRDICVAKLQATIDYLRKVVKTTEKTILVSSMDNSQSNHLAAVLVAAAAASAPAPSASEQEDMDVDAGNKECVRLFIGGVEQKQLRSFDSIVSLLDEIMLGTQKNVVDAPSFMESGTATTKAVVNLVDRHLGDKEALLLLSSADIQVPSDVMKGLTARGCSIHCHDSTDTTLERLSREGARKGDVTISLAWDTVDDLDLHVHVPSGEHIYYSHRSSKDGLCQLDVDMNAGGKQSEEPVENVTLGDLDARKQAPLGHYKVVVQNYAYHSGKVGPIPFRVIVDKNGKKERFNGECRGSGSTSNVTVCEFDYAGRTVPYSSTTEGGGEASTAFGTSNVVSLTASTGQTLESLGMLTQTVAHLEHLDRARVLANEEEQAMEEGDDADDGAAGGDDADGDNRPEVAQHGHLEVTSRDYLNIRLAKLPARFHQIIGEEFGGATLAEECAKEISRRMVTGNIPISELRRNGYPEDIIGLVKQSMATAFVDN